jgi:hypothetical protein
MWLERNRAEAEDLVQETLMQARQLVPGVYRSKDCSACIKVSCTRSSASARLRSSHIASRKRRSACGNASASKAAHACSPFFRFLISIRRRDAL